jgi:uncharacterized protein DUF5666
VTESLTGRMLTAADLTPGVSVTLRSGTREPDGRIQVDRVMLEPKNPLTLSGQIEAVASDRSSIVVQGVSLAIDGLTGFSGMSSSGRLRSARDLATGSAVRVTLMATAAGSLRADAILGTAPPADVDDDQELKGTVKVIADTTWTVDTTAFTITDQTVFVGGPVVGDLVEVKFHVDSAGASIADRIQKEDAAPDAEFEFNGIVESIGASSWTISGRVVVVDSSTQIIGTPALGDIADVDALRAADGTLTAVRIKVEDAEPQEIEFSGIVESIGATSWTISGQAVGVDSSTQILGSPAQGDTVEVKALKSSQGAFQATRIEKVNGSGSGNGNPGEGDGGNNLGNGSGSGSGDGSGGGRGSGDGGDDGGSGSAGSGSGGD